jgi:hypothetical protein
MAQKFSIAIQMKDGEISQTLSVTRKDAQKAIDTFKKWRDEGFECYLFNAPEPDKRCKSSEPVVAKAPVLTAVKSVLSGMTKQKPKVQVADLSIE